MNDRSDVLTPDGSLYHALELFRQGKQSVLPVVWRAAASVSGGCEPAEPSSKRSSTVSTA